MYQKSLQYQRLLQLLHLFV